MEELDLDRNQLRSVEVQHLAPLRLLSTLALRYNSISELSAWPALPGLDELFLRGNAIPGRDLATLAGRCPKLSVLDVA